jgi:hypothetical protein
VSGPPSAPAARRRTPSAAVPAAPRAQIPSLARRLAIGSLRLVPLLFLYVVVPILGLQVLAAHGIGSGFDVPTVSLFGALLAVLSTARYVGRPTLAYGPLSVATSLGKVAYLLYFAAFASIHVAFSGVGIDLQFGQLLELLALVPMFGIAAGIVTSWEDLRHPGERLPFDYPAPPGSPSASYGRSPGGVSAPSR